MGLALAANCRSVQITPFGAEFNRVCRGPIAVHIGGSGAAAQRNHWRSAIVAGLRYAPASGRQGREDFRARHRDRR